jgi:hypothetical protein
MASTGLEEAYWFNTRPLYINSTGTTSYNMNTTEARNRYAVYINKSGAAGTTQINLDDIDGVGTNFPQRGRSIIFYTNANCSPASPVQINRGGSDVFLPSFNGNALNIILDEPWQVCEIHGNYNENDGSTWWQVIRRTTEQRRNSYGQYRGEGFAVDGCYPVLLNSVLQEYGVALDTSANVVRFPYAGKWKISYGVTMFWDGPANTLEVGLSLVKSGTLQPASTIFQTFHNKGHYYQLHGSYLLSIEDPVNDYLDMNLYADDTITLVDYAPEFCTDAPAAYMDIIYAGGGYGIDYTV